jgi:hypothetical protein
MLDLHALDLYRPPAAAHSSRLGAKEPYVNTHLFDKAGAWSRPPTVARGVMAVACDAFDVPTAAAAERSTDMASLVVGRMLAGQRGQSARVGAILHAQCTLDQQKLGSTPLRLRHDHLPDVPRYATIGQLGTAGLPTALRLAACPPLPGGGADRPLTCVSAADKWLAPFVQHFPGLLSYADAAAACLAAPSGGHAYAIAHVLDMEISTRPLPYDLWTAPAQAQEEFIFAHVQDCAERVRRRADFRRAGLRLIGDCMAAPLGERLAGSLGMARLADAAPCHLSSASALFSIGTAIEAAAAREQILDALVWTASLGGQAAAMLVRCRPDAVRTQTGWTARS